MLCAHALNLANSAASLRDRALTYWTVNARAILLENWAGVLGAVEVDQVLQFCSGCRSIECIVSCEIVICIRNLGWRGILPTLPLQEGQYVGALLRERLHEGAPISCAISPEQQVLSALKVYVKESYQDEVADVHGFIDPRIQSADADTNCAQGFAGLRYAKAGRNWCISQRHTRIDDNVSTSSKTFLAPLTPSKKRHI